uniref:Uncharacterized protein n=1 Tax=Aegilops tauschii subsp. strangulata TaxID=200361 RepID=A0A453K063_AEGTS
MDKTFGFDTAVEAAQRAINSAYIEVIHFSNLSDSHLMCIYICKRAKNILSYWLPLKLKLYLWFALYGQAHSAFHGIGLVKLMGRSSGFITMHASLSSGQVDICLIPEVSNSSTCAVYALPTHYTPLL